MLDDATRYRLLQLLEAHPDLSQRGLAQRAGLSLGKTNYLVRALIDKGWVKIQNFRDSHNKTAYLYKLTPAGAAEKVRVTRRFLQRKLEEHAQLEADIERLRTEVQRHHGAPE